MKYQVGTVICLNGDTSDINENYWNVRGSITDVLSDDEYRVVWEPTQKQIKAAPSHYKWGPENHDEQWLDSYSTIVSQPNHDPTVQGDSDYLDILVAKKHIEKGG